MPPARCRRAVTVGDRVRLLRPQARRPGHRPARHRRSTAPDRAQSARRPTGADDHRIGKPDHGAADSQGCAAAREPVEYVAGQGWTRRHQIPIADGSPIPRATTSSAASGRTSRGCGRSPSSPSSPSTSACPGVSGGFVGVDVFFVVSGFLITRLILGELAASGTVSLRNFWGRRARRLLPASTLTVVVTVLFAQRMLPPLVDAVAGHRRHRRRHVHDQLRVRPPARRLLRRPARLDQPVAAAALLVAGRRGAVLPVLAAAARPAHPPPAAVPPARAGDDRRARHRQLRRRPVADGATRRRGRSSCCRRGWASCSPAPRSPSSARASRRSRRRWRAALGWVGVLGIVVACVGFDETIPWPGAAVLVPVVATMAVIVGGTANAPAWAPATRPRRRAAAVGRPALLRPVPLALAGARARRGGVGSAQLAAALRGDRRGRRRLGALGAARRGPGAPLPLPLGRVAAQPGARRGDVRARRRRRVGPALVDRSASTAVSRRPRPIARAPSTTVTPSGTSPPTTTARPRPRRSPWRPSADPVDDAGDARPADRPARPARRLDAAGAAPVVGLVPGAVEPPSVAGVGARPVGAVPRRLREHRRQRPAAAVRVRRRRTAARTILLYGDSHAVQWFEPLEQIALQRGYRLVVLAKGGCPVAEVDVPTPVLHYTCPPYRDRAIAWIESNQPDLVVVGNSYTQYPARRRRVGRRAPRRRSTGWPTRRSHVVVIGDNPASTRRSAGLPVRASRRRRRSARRRAPTRSCPSGSPPRSPPPAPTA